MKGKETALRERWIDNAKGIAILLIIISHVSKGLQGFWNFDFVDGFNLAIFFLISGYTMKRTAISREYHLPEF